MHARFRLLPHLTIIFLSVTAIARGQTPPVTNAPAAMTNVVAAPVAPAQVVSEAEGELAKLRNISAEPTTDAQETDISTRLPNFTLETKFRADEAQRVLESHPSIDQLRTLENTWKFLAGTPAGWKDTLTKRATDLGATLATLDDQKKQWLQTQQAVSGPGIPAEVTQRIQAVLTQLPRTSQQVADRQTKVLALQDQVTRQDALITAMLATIAQARSEAVNQLFVQDSPPLWKINQDENATPAAAPLPSSGWSAQMETLRDYLSWQSGRFLAHAALFVFLLILFYWLRGQSRTWAATESGATSRKAAQLFETPACAALLLALVLGSHLYPIAPRLLLALMGAIALLPAVVILRRLIEPRLFPILNALIAFFFVQEFRSVVSLSPTVSRLFFLTEMLAAVIFLTWLLLSRRLAQSEGAPRFFSKALRFSAKCALAFVVAGWFANVLGFVSLGNLLCEAVQRSANVALILYAGLQILVALLQIAFHLRPFSTLEIVRQHADQLTRRSYRALGVGAGILWVLFTLEMFSLRAPILTTLETFFTRRLDGHLYLTLPGKLVALGLIIWGAMLISRFARFVMETDVYPRLRLAHGVPYAISTTLHYAVLVVAFMAAASALGIDMTKFTILVSAFGVGIGFGLQNIINNFVSGLILLFERPVKIGDSVQVGDTVGVVERIGIRASVLRAVTGAEIIVPNGSLISDRVTNWTLSSQERIISIPLTVARGPEVTHIIELLVTTARAHPKVLPQPPPQVLVLTLGATLSFELRAWTSESAEWSLVRSDLILAINAALTRENMTIG